MSTQTNQKDPDVRGLFGLFPQPEYMAYAELVADEQVPEPYHGLLVHEHHMTVTVERHHGSPVDVRVLQEYRGQRTYARKILLELQSDRRRVLFGLVRIHLRFCDDVVRAKIDSTNSGERALELVSRMPYQLVVADCGVGDNLFGGNRGLSGSNWHRIHRVSGLFRPPIRQRAARPPACRLR